jgi:N-acetylmuramoyl-L-alanine amidase
MLEGLQTIFYITKEKTVQNRRLGLRLAFLLVTAFLSIGLFHGSAMAASGLRIYNYATKKESIYTDKQIKVTLNGKTVTKDGTPGILVKGIALVPYNDVFEKSDITAECDYDKAEGTVSIAKYGKTLKMTIGSTKAKLNGQTVTLPVAPMKIKFVKAGLVKVLVPSRFVAETLGLKYTWNSSKSTVAIEKTTLVLSYDGAKKFEYTGAQGKVTVNGKNIDLGNMPSIITNNTAMLRAKGVFTNPAIGATYRYDNSQKKITLTKGDKELVMTVGDKTAYLNGIATKMETAPMIVTNHNVGTSYVMVPGSFTASCLGFDYTWNNTTRTSMITDQKSTNPGNSGGSGNTPELGDSGVIIEVGTILNQWIGDSAKYAVGSEVHELSGVTPANPGVLSSVTRDYSNVKQNAETFQFFAVGGMGNITSSKTDKQLQLQISNLTCTDATYQMYGIYSNYVNIIGTYGGQAAQTLITLDLVSSDFTYDITLSSDKQLLYVTVYYNALTSAVVGTNNAGDYVTLTGIKPLKVTMNKTTGYLNIDLPGTLNSLGDIYAAVTGSKYVNMFYTISTADKTQLVIGVNEGYEYYVAEDNNKYSFLFLTPGGGQQQPNIPGTQPGPSDQLDPSECEIIIPKPAGLTASMITDEDYYFEHSFVLRLSGDYTGVLNSSNIINSSSRVENIKVTLNNNNETEVRFKTTKLQGYQYTMDDKNIYVKIGNPKDIYPNIVILDPGHGGGANGAQYYGTNEKDLNFKILYTLGKKYFNQDTSKLKVYYTRIKDVDISLSNRAAFASQYGADLFVSLHMNANLNRTVYGTEVYYADHNNSPNRAGLTSKKLADLFSDRISSKLGTKNRGSRSERYTVVYKNTVPAVLIELGFMSTESDFEKLSNPTFQENAAKTIYETLLEVFEKYPTGR